MKEKKQLLILLKFMEGFFVDQITASQYM